jgi:hypothetical protein
MVRPASVVTPFRIGFLRLALAGLIALLAPSAAHAQDDLKVQPLVRDGHVLVSCELADGYTDDVRAFIQSGLQTTFSYTVELRMRVPAWVDRTLASAVVSTTVEFDNLTRQHTVSRLLDGRVQESRVIDDEAEVRKLLTTFDRVPLFKTAKLEPNREYYVLVRARARPRNGSIFFPWDSAPAGSAKFTFVP